MNALVTMPEPHETPASAGDQARHTIFSPRAQGTFLESLSVNGNVRLACRAAKVSPQTAYRARRRQPAFARAWDAALLSARDHAEQVLADRALNGIEEPVFYHGEEVAMRRRYSDRLLLAHLARLDRLEQREEVRETLEHLDDAIEALEKGEELPERVPVETGTSGGGAQQPEAPACAGDHGRENSSLDRVPCVPSCRNSPPSSSEGPQAAEGGRPNENAVGHAKTYEAPTLEWRLQEMNFARPVGAKLPHELAVDNPHLDAQTIEEMQLHAFEEEFDEWWLIVPTREEWDAAAP